MLRSLLLAVLCLAGPMAPGALSVEAPERPLPRGAGRDHRVRAGAGAATRGARPLQPPALAVPRRPGGLFYVNKVEVLCDQAWGSMLEVPAGSRLNLTGLGYFSCHSHTVVQDYSYFFFLRMDENYNLLPHGVSFQDAIFQDTQENRRMFSSLFQFSNYSQGQQLVTFSSDWEIQGDNRMDVLKWDVIVCTVCCLLFAVSANTVFLSLQIKMSQLSFQGRALSSSGESDFPIGEWVQGVGHVACRGVSGHHQGTEDTPLELGPAQMVADVLQDHREQKDLEGECGQVVVEEECLLYQE
uniref:Coiled-coil domain containing 3 n=1 Tax=Callithrix jacchus TaxID=9483 RepID=A0A5F4VRM9_CALJA